jgi:hypothetical protein
MGAVFKPGQRVVVLCNYMSLTQGKVYTVKEYIPRSVHPTFTFPPYLTVWDDSGKLVTGHDHRFKPLEVPNGPCDE